MTATAQPQQPAAPRTSRPTDLRAPRPAGWRREGECKQNQDPLVLNAQLKRIVICADGTWNRPGEKDDGGPAPTNVWLLYQLVPERAIDGRPQLAYYHPGVGTGGVVDRIIGGVCGIGLKRNILDCYRFLVDHYHRGDAIYLFGFSRGAYTVRSLAGLIRKCGIIDRDRFSSPSARYRAIMEAFALYRKRGDATAPTADKAVDFRASHSHPDCRITCIGVWDTVGALGIPVGWLGKLSQHVFGFHDVTLSSWVDRAFHAVAVDERRRPFTPTLWQLQPGASTKGQHVEQVWFAGAHSDIGGGYPLAKRELANTTLRWMVDRVTEHCRLDFATSELPSAASSQLVVHDPYKWYYRLLGLPIARYIDPTLGRYGTRDPFRLTAERVDETVSVLRQDFAVKTIPILDRPYAPENVADYDRRMSLALKNGSAGAQFHPTDLKDRGRP